MRKINKERLEKIVIEASEQSNRINVPLIESPQTLDGFLKKNSMDLIFTDLNSDNIKIDKSKLTDKPVCISRKDVLQNNNYIYTLVTLDMENDFPIALTYNAIAGDEENWNKPITQTTLVKNCKAF